MWVWLQGLLYSIYYIKYGNSQQKSTQEHLTVCEIAWGSEKSLSYSFVWPKIKVS